MKPVPHSKDLSIAASIVRWAVVLVLLLTVAGRLSAQTEAAAALGISAPTNVPSLSKLSEPVPAATSRPETGAIPLSSKGKPVGKGAGGHNIQVSGWWKIDIKNPDGQVARHVEFENTIFDSGTNLLNYLLTGRVVAGEAMVEMTSSSTTNPCGSSGSLTGCHIFPTSNGYWGSACIQNAGYACDTTPIDLCSANPATCAATLSTAIVSQPDGSTALQLSGQIVAAQNGSMDTVGTYFMVCNVRDKNGVPVGPSPTSPVTSGQPNLCQTPQGTAAANTYYPDPIAFTGTTIAPISVIKGQTIQASVLLSFGTAELSH